MKLDIKNIAVDKVLAPANFAKTKNVDRKWIYALFKDDLLDYVEIDGVKFVYLNEKAKEYKKTRRINN